MDLGSLAAAMGRYAAHVEDHPLDWMDWTVKQWSFLGLVSGCPLSLFRAGNQIGKTIVGAAATIARCLGVDLATGRRLSVPVEAWVVCTSWAQSVAIMGKVWSLVPKSELRPGQRYNARTGFGKDNPALEFANGSMLRFRTTNQGPEALAGATIDWVWIDEPTDLDIFRELQKRVMRRNGRLIITLTPINRPCEWLHELADKGVVREVHARLDADALTFRSGQRMKLADGTPMDDDWITEQRRVTPPLFAPVVLDGEWETRPEGVFFVNFDQSKHLAAAPKFKLNATSKLSWRLGIDYAAADRDFGQVAVLARTLLVPRRGAMGSDVWVHVVDEVVMGGTATTEQFADEIAAMLARNGIEWRHLDTVHGDNPVESFALAKSNTRTARAMADRLGITLPALKPAISGAKDGPKRTSLREPGCRFLYAMIEMRRLLIHPRCKHMVRGLETWDYSEMHSHKDVIDALRYALKPVIFPYGTGVRQNLRAA